MLQVLRLQKRDNLICRQSILNSQQRRLVSIQLFSKPYFDYVSVRSPTKGSPLPVKHTQKPSKRAAEAAEANVDSAHPSTKRPLINKV
jgi:hypothetical protein